MIKVTDADTSARDCRFDRSVRPILQVWMARGGGKGGTSITTTDHDSDELNRQKKLGVTESSNNL